MEDMVNGDILITGNMGYIGPVLVSRLTQTRPRTRLHGLDLGFFAHCLTGSPFLPECLLTTQDFGDVRAPADRTLQGVASVVQLAAISNDPMGNRFGVQTEAINGAAAIDLAKKAKAAGARSFVFASSCSIYGNAPGEARDESAPLTPLTAYARSKVAAEQGLAALADDSFVITCLRFPTACGFSPRLRLDLVLNDFVASALATGNITVLSDGTPWRPLIHVTDMVRAVDWAIDRPAEAGGAFLAVNTGADNLNFQIKDLAGAVADCLPGVSVSINTDAPPDNRSYQVSFARFAALAPQWARPQLALADMVEDLRTGLSAMDFADPEFRSSRYIRLKVLNDLVDAGTLNTDLNWAGNPS